MLLNFFYKGLATEHLNEKGREKVGLELKKFMVKNKIF